MLISNGVSIVGGGITITAPIPITYFTDSYYNSTVLHLNGETPAISWIADASTLTNAISVSTNSGTTSTRFSPILPQGYYSNLFNGSTDSITTATTTPLTLSSGNYTLECWIYLTSGSGANTGQTVVGTTTGIGSGWGLVVNRTTAGQGFLWSINNVILLSYTAAYLAAGQWYHIAIVRNGTGTNNTVGYLNGIAVVQTTDNTNDTSTVTPLYIGSQNNNGAAQNFPGYVSNLRLVKGAAVYTANFTPPTSPLTLYGTQTSLLTCIGPGFIDYSPNNFSFGIVGTPKVQTSQPFSALPSTVNNYTNGYYSNYFNGSSYFTIASNPIFAFGTNNFTVEAWVLLNSFTNNRFIEGITGTGGLELNVSSTGFPQWAKYGVGTILTSNTAINLNTWYHIAVTRVSGITFMFINGATVGIVTDSYSYPQTAVRIGGDAAPTNYFNGLVSNLRIVNGTAVYTNNFTPPTQPLTVVNSTQTSLLVCLNQQLIDSSTYANTVTNVGVTVNIQSPLTVPTTSTSVTALGSGQFDGNSGYLSAVTLTALGTNNFTIEGWFYANSVASSAALVDTRNPDTANAGFSIFINSGTPTLAFGTNLSNYIVGSTTISVGQWYHFSIVRNGNLFTAYLNGISQGTYSGSSSQNFVNTSTRIGYGANGYFSGYISNLRIVNGAALYTTNFAIPNQSLTTVTGTTGTTTLLTLQNRQSHNNNVFYDDSPNNFAITRTGTPTQGTFTPFSQNGWSNYFDGSTGYLNIGTPLALGSGNWTIEFWYNLQTIPSSASPGAIIDMRGGTNGPGVTQPALYIDNSGGFRWYTNAANLVISGYPATIVPNTWQHFAIVKNNGTTTMYINGSSVGSASDSKTYPSSTTLIGKTYDGVNNFYIQGNLSNFRITNSAVYTTAFTPPTAALTTATGSTGTVTLLTAQSNRFVDNSTYANTLTITGSVSVQPIAPFANTSLVNNSYSTTLVGGSMYFNGSTDNLNFPNITVGTNAFTIECWFYLLNLSAAYALIGSSNTTGLSVRIVSSTSFTIDSYNISNTPFTVPTLNPNSWYHIAVVRNASNVATIFVNGIRSSTGAVTVTTNFSGGTNTVGIYPSGSYFPGYISNMRVVLGNNVYDPTQSSITIPPAPLTVISTVTSVSTSTSTIASTSLLLLGTNSGVVDQTGRNDLITVGTATISASTFKYGAGSIYIPGTGNYVQTVGTKYWIPTALTTFTVEAWIYMTQLPTGSTNPGMVGDITPTSNTDNWSFGPVSTGVLQFYWYTGSANTAAGNTVISTGTWTHIAASINASAISLFVNGVSQTVTGTTTLTARSSTLNYLTIGQYNSGGANQYYGYVDDLRITQGVARYSSGTNFTPPLAEPVQ